LDDVWRWKLEDGGRKWEDAVGVVKNKLERQRGGDI